MSPINPRMRERHFCLRPSPLLDTSPPPSVTARSPARLCPRTTTARQPSPEHTTNHVGNRNGVQPFRGRLWKPHQHWRRYARRRFCADGRGNRCESSAHAVSGARSAHVCESPCARAHAACAGCRTPHFTCVDTRTWRPPKTTAASVQLAAPPVSLAPCQRCRGLSVRNVPSTRLHDRHGACLGGRAPATRLKPGHDQRREVLFSRPFVASHFIYLPTAFAGARALRGRARRPQALPSSMDMAAFTEACGSIVRIPQHLEER